MGDIVDSVLDAPPAQGDIVDQVLSKPDIVDQVLTSPPSLTPETDRALASTKAKNTPVMPAGGSPQIPTDVLAQSNPEQFYKPSEHPLAEKVAGAVTEKLGSLVPKSFGQAVDFIIPGSPVSTINEIQNLKSQFDNAKAQLTGQPLPHPEMAPKTFDQFNQDDWIKFGVSTAFDIANAALVGKGLSKATGEPKGAKPSIPEEDLGPMPKDVPPDIHEPAVESLRPPEAGLQEPLPASFGRTEGLPAGEPITQRFQEPTGPPVEDARVEAELGTPIQEPIPPQISETTGQPIPREPIGTTDAIAEIQRRNAPEPAIPDLTSDESHVSSIANRFINERAAKGEIGEVVPGKGASTVDLVQKGLQMPPEEVTQHVSDLMQDTGDIVKQGQAIRAEEARLSQRSNELSRVAEKNPSDVEAKLNADNAFKDLTDFHNGPVAKLKNKWHSAGMEMQGEIPVDLTTYNGLREQWLKDTGEVPPAHVEPILRKTAEKVSNAVNEENGARSRLSQEIDRTPTKLTVDEVRNRIREQMGLGPCPI